MFGAVMETANYVYVIFLPIDWDANPLTRSSQLANLQ